MKDRSRLILPIMMIAAIVIITSIIFFLSFGDYATSHSASDVVIDVVLPDQDTDNDYVELIVRKMAHLIEYAALGIVVMLFVKYMEKNYLKGLYGAALFYVLLVAVLDEHIQRFSDRTSSTGDILLDFFGALIGFTLVFVILLIRVKLKNRTAYKALAETVSEAEQKEQGRS